MDRKDDMDLESLKNMLSDVPDTDEFDLDSIIAEVSGQAPAKAAEPKIAAEPEKPVEPQPAPAAETKAEEPKTAPRNKKDKTAKKAAETAAAAEHESVEEAREARIAAREQKMEERERRTAQKIAERQARREAKLAEKEAAEKAAEQQEIVEEAAAEAASRKASISRKQARAARIAADQAEEEEDIKLVDPETAMHAARRRSGILSFRSLLVLILAAAAAYLSFAPSFEALPLPVVLDILQNPTIGIGAGAGCDGKVLGYQDMLGMNMDFTPKFAKQFDNIGERMVDAFRTYMNEVQNGTFPTEKQSFVKSDCSDEYLAKLDAEF